MTGSMCLRSAALGWRLESSKDRRVYQNIKGGEMSEIIKQQDFLLEKSEQKAKNLFEFFMHKDLNKRGMQGWFFPPTAITFDTVERIKQDICRGFWD